MQRNIITPEDIALHTGTPRSGDSPAATQLQSDDYLARVLKQIPFEIVGAYLVLDGIIRTGYKPGDPNLGWALVILFALGIVGSVAYARSILQVIRRLQLTMTAFAFAVWVFATGGWFSLTSWYAPWMGSGAVVVFAVLVRIIKVSPLPEPPPG